MGFQIAVLSCRSLEHYPAPLVLPVPVGCDGEHLAPGRALSAEAHKGDADLFALKTAATGAPRPSRKQGRCRVERRHGKEQPIVVSQRAGLRERPE